MCWNMKIRNGSTQNQLQLHIIDSSLLSLVNFQLAGLKLMNSWPKSNAVTSMFKAASLSMTATNQSYMCLTCVVGCIMLCRLFSKQCGLSFCIENLSSNAYRPRKSYMGCSIGGKFPIFTVSLGNGTHCLLPKPIHAVYAYISITQWRQDTKTGEAHLHDGGGGAISAVINHT